MFFPSCFTRFDILMTHRTPIGSLSRLGYPTTFIFDMLFKDGLWYCFFAPWTLRKGWRLVTLSYQVVSISCYLYHLTTIFAFSKHFAIFPKVDIKVFTFGKGFIAFATKLALLRIFILLYGSSLFSLTAWFITCTTTFSIFIRRKGSFLGSSFRIYSINFCKACLQMF